MPPFPEVNFDVDVVGAVEEISTLSHSLIRRFFQNEDVVRELVPALSGTGEFFRALAQRLRRDGAPADLVAVVEQVTA